MNEMWMAGTYYDYLTTHAHVVYELNNMQKYWYDNNGNMTSRIVSDTTYPLTYDAENRMTSVSGGSTATFVYDGDGNGGTLVPAVKATVNGITTTFIGPHFEWHTDTTNMVKYYYAGSQRIAMRQGLADNVNLKWLLGDHLGSTSVSADYDGDLLSRTLSKPWGEVRYQSGTLPTAYTFTGQYSHTDDFGLMYYVARWYDPLLGRFAQADTIIPGAGNPLAYDCYICKITPSETLTRLDIGLRRGLTLPRLYMTYTTSARMA